VYITCNKIRKLIEGKEPDPENEPKGQGVNKNTYFVTTSLTEPWVELDDCKPSLLKASRKIKYVFSGNLNKPIISNPWFNGKESDYLRCQIARISHNITIIPNIGKYKVNETDKRELEEPNDEIKDPNINESLQLNNWVHLKPSILNEGRLVHQERDPPEGMEAEEFKKQIIANDPFEPRLKPISSDENLKCPINNIKLPAWKISYCYDDKIYTNPDIIINTEDADSLKLDTTVSHTIVHLRNLTWPGAHVVRIKGQIQYYYFGWGMKYNDDILEDKFVFQAFPQILSENKDLPISIDPNIPEGEPQDVNDNNKDKDNDLDDQ
jgi:radial spoke head protein 4/6